MKTDNINVYLCPNMSLANIEFNGDGKGDLFGGRLELAITVELDSHSAKR